VFTLLFLLHRENGDFSILMKDIWLLVCCRLPERFAEGARVLVADPMLATGGTIVAAIEELTKRGVDLNLLRVVSLMAGNELCQFVSVCDPYMLISHFCICSGILGFGIPFPGESNFPCARNNRKRGKSLSSFSC
jgi:hypothetical protein